MRGGGHAAGAGEAEGVPPRPAVPGGHQGGAADGSAPWCMAWPRDSAPCTQRVRSPCSEPPAGAGSELCSPRRHLGGTTGGEDTIRAHAACGAVLLLPGAGASPMLTLPCAGPSSHTGNRDTSSRARGSSWFLWVASPWRRPPGAVGQRGGAWQPLAPHGDTELLERGRGSCGMLGVGAAPWGWGHWGWGTSQCLRGGTAGEGSLSGPAVMGHGVRALK